MDEKERFYDDEVAPKLLELSQACKARGMSFLGLVEYGPGLLARTESLQGDAGIGQLIAHWAARADGNVDALMMACRRHAQQHGHSSAVLHLLDVPLVPEGAEPNPDVAKF